MLYCLIKCRIRKISLISFVERVIYPVLEFFGFPLYRVSPDNNEMHCSVLMVLMSIIFLYIFALVKKNRCDFLVVFTGSVITFIIVFLMQFYFAPMYWRVPGFFRYIFPAFLCMFGICSVYSIKIIQETVKWKACFMGFLIIYLLASVGFPAKGMFQNYSEIDWGMAIWNVLHRSNIKKQVYYASISREGSIEKHTITELFRHKNISIVHSSEHKQGGTLFLYNKHIAPEAHMPAFTINGEKRYGVYVGKFNPAAKKIEFNHVCAPKKLFENLSRMYGLKNASSAAYPALVCDVKGGFERGAWPAEGWQIVSKRKKLAGPEDDPEVSVEIQRNFFSGNLITVTNRSKENITLRSEQLFSVYPQDIITVKGLLASDGEIMTALSLFALNDGKYKYLKAIYQKNRGVKDELNPFESVIKVNYPFSLNDELYFSVFFVIPPGKTFVLKEIEVLHSSTGQCLTDFINWLE